MFNGIDDEHRVERLFSLRRIRTLVIGVLIAGVLGFLAVNLFTYLQYGGTFFDRYFQKKEQSTVAGKLAFDKGTKYYIGVIRGEGRTSRLGNVYYIEQAGGNFVEVSKENVEVRNPEKIEK